MRIKTKEIFILKVKSLEANFNKLKYDDMEKLIINIDNFIENSPKNFFADKATKVALAEYYWKKSCHIEYGDIEGAYALLNKAAAIMKEAGELETYYDIILRLSLIKVYAGDIEAPAELLKKVDHTNYSRLWFYYYVKARAELERGRLKEALSLVEQAINEENKFIINGQTYNEFTAAYYLLKTEILINLGKIEEAKEVFFPLYQVAKDNFDKENELYIRVLIAKALIEAKNEDMKEATRTTNEALERLADLHKSLQNTNYDKIDDNLANLYVLIGDIANHKGDFKEAFNNYTKAHEVYSNRYRDNIKLERVGMLFEKLVNVSLVLEDKVSAKFYYNLHDSNFSYSHPRTRKIHKDLLAAKVL